MVNLSGTVPTPTVSLTLSHTALCRTPAVSLPLSHSRCHTPAVALTLSPSECLTTSCTHHDGALLQARSACSSSPDKFKRLALKVKAQLSGAKESLYTGALMEQRATSQAIAAVKGHSLTICCESTVLAALVGLPGAAQASDDWELALNSECQ